MSQPSTVTINQVRGKDKVPVTLTRAEFEPLYTHVGTRLCDMAARFNITIPGVRRAAELFGLPHKAAQWKFKPKYADVNFGERELRQLLVTENLSYTKTAVLLGVTEYYVRREAVRLGIETPGRSSHKHRECIPPVQSHRRVCEFLPVCRQLEPSGEPLRCEVLLDDEPIMGEIERDSTPTIGANLMAYCGGGY
jgi:hypothetical protein